MIVADDKAIGTQPAQWLVLVSRAMGIYFRGTCKWMWIKRVDYMADVPVKGTNSIIQARPFLTSFGIVSIWQKAGSVAKR